MFKFFAYIFPLFLFFIFQHQTVTGKFVEGEINTKDDWTFLARFCFLSEEGQFEYRIEFNEQQGYPNLLLYYDTDDQWPSVYKSDKTCQEKESVLKMGQNQIVNLTIKPHFYQEFSGCYPVENRKSFVAKTSSKQTTSPITKSTSTTVSPKRSSTLTSTTVKNTESPDIYTTISPELDYETFSPITVYDFDNISSDFSNYSGENYYQDVEIIYKEGESTTNSTEDQDNFGTTSEPTRRKRSIIQRPTTASKSNQDRIIVCQNSRRFRSSRERWWFIAISNCGSNKGIHLKYKLLMTNGPIGDPWHEHFSADEFYVLPILLAFSVSYSFLFLCVIVCTIELKSRQLLHSTYKLFSLSVVLQFFGIIIKSMAYLKFAFNGIGTPKLKTFGEILMAASETSFLLVLILLAKGYTVTRGRLSVNSGVKLTIYMCLYSITYICLFIYEEKVFDPGQVLYLYESPAGYGLIFLRIVVWIIFIYSTIITLKHYPEKSMFYYPLNIFGTFWFVAGPAFILSANTYIDKWVRESVVNAVLLLITFGGHVMFLVLTMPSRANKNFPYHVRTTQIGVMEVTGPDTPQNFSHYPYEPSSDPYGQTVIIPLTKRTEELLGGIYSHKLNSSLNMPSYKTNNALDGGKSHLEVLPDDCMQNVLSWALAKDSSTLSVPPLEIFYQGGSFRSSHSRESEICQFSPTFERKNGSKIIKNDFSDYVRDVPVELFSISKMVVTTNKKNEDNDQDRS